MQDVHPTFLYFGLPIKFGDLFVVTKDISMFCEERVKPQDINNLSGQTTRTYTYRIDKNSLIVLMDMKKTLIPWAINKNKDYKAYEFYFFVNNKSCDSRHLYSKLVICNKTGEIAKELEILGMRKIL